MNVITLAIWSCNGRRILRRLFLTGAVGFGLWTTAHAAELLLPAMNGMEGNHRNSSDQAGFSDEYPARYAELDSFYLLAEETTKSLWDEVRAWGLVHGYPDLPEGTDGGGTITGPSTTHPVVNVSWYDAAKWCNALSEMEGFEPVYVLDAISQTPFRTGELEQVCTRWDSSGWRLPSEQEWELAARGGLPSNDYPWASTSTFYEENISPSQACYRAGGTLPVESFAANGFGLYDMAGNVAEWCGDVYYATNDVSLPHGPAASPLAAARSVRGGSWRSGPIDLRVASRGMAHPSHRMDHVGFRLARTWLPSWDSGYTSIGGGWRRLNWFGDYIPMGNEGWIWHNKHGFLYAPPSAEPSNIWFFAMDMGWLYTENSLYPFLYRSDPSSWLWYNGSSNPRWFMNLTENRWENRP